jgi:hypothetical protein
VLSLSEKRENRKMDILGLANFGILLLVIGIIFVMTPNLVDRVGDFFRSFHTTEVAPNVFLPVPTKDHPVVFNAIFLFCLIFGILQIGILAARFITKDTVRRTASTVMGIIFWLGAAFTMNLLITQNIRWLTFAGYIIAILGIAILVENIIVLAIRRD